MKAKYKGGKQIKTVADFEQSKSLWFRVMFGPSNERTIHRGFLVSWQYQTLWSFIYRGWVFEADQTDENDGIHGMKEGMN